MTDQYEVRDGLGQSHRFTDLASARRFAAKRNTFTWAQIHPIRPNR